MFHSRGVSELRNIYVIERGYEARVVGDSRPFRVRVGRYPTRERAAEVVRQLSRSNTRGFVVEAEPR